MIEFAELIYLRDRSIQEFQMAQRASNPLVSRPHYRMAVAYQERADSLKRKLISAAS